ncbi:MAG TPA: hypothetical protein DEF45_11095 [Rhodopirellula sp.]|nr:hypothetical protein [Rhodopirellula sp.]
MNENRKVVKAENELEIGAWDRYWFSNAPVAPVSMIRGLLALITLIYFFSAWSDAVFWYADGGPLSETNVSAFLTTGGLESAGRWIVSPLFLTESPRTYQLYLICGIATALAVLFGRGGRWMSFVLWCLFVGWANRAMLLSGLAETLLSLGLFASAISPAGSMWTAFSTKRQAKRNGSDYPVVSHWTAGFSQRLLATQITVIGVATWVAMLGGRVWFNGLGAYALAAPVEDRTIDWTGADSLLVQVSVHEGVTHLMMIALPLGLILAWLPKSSQIGKFMVVSWSLAIGMLGSHWIYAMTFAVLVFSIRPSAVGGDSGENARGLNS